jgi:hypothetical protein
MSLGSPVFLPQVTTRGRVLRHHPSAYVSIRQHTSAYGNFPPPFPESASRRQHTSAYVSIRQAYVSIRQHTSAYVSIRQHTSAYVSIRQHTSACVGGRLCFRQVRTRAAMLPFAHTRPPLRACCTYVSIRQHTLAYVSIRQHTSAYVSLSRTPTSVSLRMLHARQHTQRT